MIHAIVAFGRLYYGVMIMMERLRCFIEKLEKGVPHFLLSYRNTIMGSNVVMDVGRSDESVVNLFEE